MLILIVYITPNIYLVLWLNYLKLVTTETVTPETNYIVLVVNNASQLLAPLDFVPCLAKMTALIVVL